MIGGLQDWRIGRVGRIEIKWKSYGFLFKKLKKFEDLGAQHHLVNSLEGLWERSLDLRGTKTRLRESWRAQTSSRRGKKDRQKGVKMPPRTLNLADLAAIWREHVIQMAATR